MNPEEYFSAPVTLSTLQKTPETWYMHAGQSRLVFVFGKLLSHVSLIDPHEYLNTPATLSTLDKSPETWHMGVGRSSLVLGLG